MQSLGSPRGRFAASARRPGKGFCAALKRPFPSFEACANYMIAMTKSTAPPDWLRRLRDVRGVRRELARIYGDARTGGLAWQDASRAANVLQILGRLIEGGELEQRIEALEAASENARGGPGRSR